MLLIRQKTMRSKFDFIPPNNKARNLQKKRANKLLQISLYERKTLDMSDGMKIKYLIESCNMGTLFTIIDILNKSIDNNKSITFEDITDKIKQIYIETPV